MTMQEVQTHQETISQLRGELETLAAEYNSALADKAYDKLPDITTKMDEKVSKYAQTAKTVFLGISSNAESPLTDALERLTYSVIAYKDNADKETQTVTRIITEKTKQIALDDCFKTFPSEFHSNIWKRYVEKFNQLLCLNVADDIGATNADKELIRSRFAMQQASRELDIGKPSNTMLLKQLQLVIDQIYYEEEEFKGETRNRIRVSSHDVKFLQHAYTKMGREVKKISTLNSAKFANVLAQILNKLITDTAYGVEFKQAKDVPAAGEVEVVNPPKKVKKAKKETQAPEAKPVPDAESAA